MYLVYDKNSGCNVLKADNIRPQVKIKKTSCFIVLIWIKTNNTVPVGIKFLLLILIQPMRITPALRHLRDIKPFYFLLTFSSKKYIVISKLYFKRGILTMENENNPIPPGTNPYSWNQGFLLMPY